MSPELERYARTIPIYDGLVIKPGHTIKNAERFRRRLLRDLTI